MKRLYTLFLLFVLSICCFSFLGCKTEEKITIDPNEFIVEKISQSNGYVLFGFTYTQEMFDYEIKYLSLRSHNGELIVRCHINNEEGLKECGSVNNMFGIKYDYDGLTLAHKPNEKVYFCMELDPGDYNVTFYLEYFANSPVVLLRECSINFSVL